MLFDIEYAGEDEFKVFLIDAAGERYERLLTPNRLQGPYDGVRALPYRDGAFEGNGESLYAYKIRVEGEGDWNVKVGLPNFDAPPITSARGAGDHVIGPFVLRSRNPFVTDFVFELTYGGRDFEARLIAPDGSPTLLVPRQDAPSDNKTATVNVFAPWNPNKSPDSLTYDEYLLEIHAEEEWTVRMLEPALEPPPLPREEIPFGRVLAEYSGLGAAEFEHTFAYAGVPGSPVLFDMEFRGGTEFEVVLENDLHLFQRRLTPDPAIGPYRGIRALPYKDGVLDGQLLAEFNVLVEGLGPWEVKIGLPDFGTPPITSAQGTGDHVVGPFVLTSEDQPRADFLFEVTHAGANFEALLIAADGSAGYLIAPQHVPFRDKQAWVTLYRPFDVDDDAGSLPLGAYVIAIQADGDWAVRLVESPPEEAAP